MTYTTVSKQVDDAMRAKMEETLNVCRAKNPGLTIPTPELKYRQLGTKAGLCEFQWLSKKCTLWMNPDFFKKYYNEQLNETLPHEVAHYVAIFIYGRQGRGHGWLWRIVMGWIGLRCADRCHSFDLEGVKHRRVSKPYVYACACNKSMNVTPHVHKKIQIQGAKYTCRRCRQRIVFQPSPTTPPLYVKPQDQLPAFNPLPVVQPATPPRVIPNPPRTLPPEQPFKWVPKFVNGSLINVKVPA